MRILEQAANQPLSTTAYGLDFGAMGNIVERLRTRSSKTQST